MKQRKSKVNLHDSSDRQENNTDLVDRIGELLDEILSNILSFLPTKQAVATSVLSKRWKFVWRTIHSLEFSTFDCRNEQIEFEARDRELIRFINRVLLLHDSGVLNKFSLNWHPECYSYDESTWINIAIAKNVHDLSLSGEIYLPVSVFSCDSLQSLELVGLITSPEEFEVCLPRLESLTIAGVYFRSEEAFENFISGCPMLNYLSLDNCYDFDFTYVISSTSLRRLKLRFEEKCSLELKASSLEYLKIRGCMPEDFVVDTSLRSVVEAYFTIRLSEDEFSDTDICDSIVKVVCAFNRAKVVSLSADVIRALSGGTISLSTKFKRLVKLVAGTYCSSLQDLIQSSDNLQVLKIVQLDDYWCSIPAQVPRCLSSSLKTVRIGCYEGLKNELEMMRYMLKYGSVLENMKIFYDKKRDGVKFELLQEICEVPRKSPACKVEFNEWTLKKKYKKLL